MAGQPLPNGNPPIRSWLTTYTPKRIIGITDTLGFETRITLQGNAHITFAVEAMMKLALKLKLDAIPTRTHQQNKESLPPAPVRRAGPRERLVQSPNSTL